MRTHVVAAQAAVTVMNHGGTYCIKCMQRELIGLWALAK